MLFFSALVASLLSILATVSKPMDAVFVSSVPGSAKIACSITESKNPQNTFFPSRAGYIDETKSHNMLANMRLRPPKFISSLPRRYHHDSNILSTSNLTTLALSSDSSTVSVGPGNRWRDVYAYLQSSGLVVLGGRVGEHGFASDNVVKYECVLGSGIIMEATATNDHSDLFWALKVGGNSFCLVTRFDLTTYRSPQVWVGIAQYDQSQRTPYLDAVYNFGAYGALDLKAAIVPTVVILPAQNVTAYAAAKFDDSELNNAAVFENFTAPQMVPVANSYSLQSLGAYVALTDPLPACPTPFGLRQEFRVMPCVVNRQAMELVHNTFTISVLAKLSGVANLTASVTFQPATKEFIRQGIARSGNPQEVDIFKAP
ncbi:hypothetical protein BCR34DRAFT_628224 [Clohesyomyces aquaticus]|uniref:FAD-binding PCMH-type domain-containing protein n=1 Tax=Clohesyomyces aquaticus TaxID=1231657 RepID=A0A1Y1YMP5_9PLEO|nr:hypothetical protein BCR34DRAFT_628224 [Clohesyomyces aquaticus]